MLTGKNIIVTGARRGIGRAVVEVLAKNGANIWACARKEDDDFSEDMMRIAEACKVSISPVFFDISDQDQVKKGVEVIRKVSSRIDVLINVAGVVAGSSSFMMTSVDKMKEVFEVNFWGTTYLTQYVSRVMMRNKAGNIVFVSSIASLDGAPAQYEYAASKAALNGAVKQLAREFSPFGIRVNGVAPGIIQTEMGMKISEELRNDTLSKVIMKREGTPQEVANVIAFLASDLSGYMTGQIIRVDGGM